MPEKQGSVNKVVIIPEDNRLGAAAPPHGEENMAISLTDPFTAPPPSEENMAISLTPSRPPFIQYLFFLYGSVSLLELAALKYKMNPMPFPISGI